MSSNGWGITVWNSKSKINRRDFLHWWTNWIHQTLYMALSSALWHGCIVMIDPTCSITWPLGSNGVVNCVPHGDSLCIMFVSLAGNFQLKITEKRTTQGNENNKLRGCSSKMELCYWLLIHIIVTNFDSISFLLTKLQFDHITFKSFLFRSLIDQYDSTNQKSNKQKKASSSISCKIRQKYPNWGSSGNWSNTQPTQKAKNQTSKRNFFLNIK